MCGLCGVCEVYVRCVWSVCGVCEVCVRGDTGSSGLVRAHVRIVETQMNTF